VTTSPTAAGTPDVRLFTISMAGPVATGVISFGDGSSTPSIGPPGGVPMARAMFSTRPADTSPAVTVREAVQVIDAPGARVATGVTGLHDEIDALASVTRTLLRVTVPELVATIE
jgi:hypothetical protein